MYKGEQNARGQLCITKTCDFIAEDEKAIESFFFFLNELLSIDKSNGYMEEMVANDFVKNF